MPPRAFVSVALATLLLGQAGSARADGVLPALATPVQREQAQARFLRGKDLMAKRQYEEALAEFRTSHEIVASPNTRLETARCLQAEGRLVAAYAELGRAAVEAKELIGQDHRYQRAYDAATAERAEIEPKLGFIALSVDHASDDTQVTVGGEEMRRAAWSEPVPVQPGETEVVVTTPARRPISRHVQVAAKERVSVSIDAQESPLQTADSAVAGPIDSASSRGTGDSSWRTASWVRPTAYVSGGVGVAGLAVFGIFGLMARATYDDLNHACGNGPCGADKAEEISSGKTQQTIANVGLVVGVVGAAAGATLFVMSVGGGSRPSSASISIAPGWVGLRGNL